CALPILTFNNEQLAINNYQSTYFKESYLYAMQSKILFITPPFTQLNTAYPASAYLKGFLEAHDIAVHTCDLSIELFTEIFTGDFLSAVFQEAQDLKHYDYPEVRKMKSLYIACVDEVIGFLQKQDIATAHKILEPGF